MKKIHYLSLAVMLVTLLFSCQQIEYQGDYAKDGFITVPKAFTSILRNRETP